MKAKLSLPRPSVLGLLGWLQSLGLEVVEVRRVPGAVAIRE